LNGRYNRILKIKGSHLLIMEVIRKAFEETKF
jgi:hypothetical protein